MSDGWSRPSWWSEAAEFFSDPRGYIVNVIAVWILGIAFGVVAWIYGLWIDIVDAVTQIPIYLLDAVEIIVIDVLEIVVDILLTVQSTYVTLVTAAGPFSWIFGALLVTAVLFAGAMVVRTTIRVIPIL